MRFLCVVLLAGCGRFGFDASDRLDGRIDDGGLPDAPAMVGVFTDQKLPPGGHARSLVLNGSFARYYVGYAGGRIFRVDNGVWTECAPIAGEPEDMALATDGTLYTTSSGDLAYSTDDCASFTVVSPPAAAYAVEASGPGDPLVGGYDGVWFFTRTTGTFTRFVSQFDGHQIFDITTAADGRIGVGATDLFGVYRAGAWRATPTAGNRNYRVVFDPVDPTVVYNVGESGVYKSTTSGDSFALTAWVGFHDMIAVDPANHMRLLVMDGGELLQSLDGLATLDGDKRTIVTSRSWPTAIAFDPLGSGKVLMTMESGLFSATDQTLQWKREDTGVNAWWVTACAETSTALYAGTTGFLWGADTGAPWGERGGKLAASAAVYGVTTSATSPDRIYSSGDSLTQSNDRGVTFSTLLGASQTDGWVFYATTEQGARLWQGSGARLTYSDNGTTWTEASLAGMTHDVPRVLVRATGTELVALTNAGVFWSVDNGTSFATSNMGLPDLDVSGTIAELHDARVVIAHQDGIWSSAARGTAWTRLGFAGHVIRDLLVTPSGALVAAVDNGVFVTHDGGVTWTELDGLSTYQPWSLAIGQGSTLLVGTRGRGLFRTALP